MKTGNFATIIMSELYKQLKDYGHVKINEPLAKHTTFKIGGRASFFIEVKENDSLVKLLNFLSENGIEYYILGGGSNILFSDDDFEGVVIKISNFKFQISNCLIEADAGVVLGKIVNEAIKNELAGLEWGAGIPGTVGGAVRGNAGAMGKDISLILEKVEVWENGEVVKYGKDDCKFEYRGSKFKKDGGIILRAWFKLEKGDKAEILKTVQGYLKQRSGRYPAFPSAGSFFQNLDLKNWPGDKKDLLPIFIERKKIPAGWLIEQCGLKGFSIGGAKVSEEHGNFIINFDHASQSDILQVVEAVKEKVYNKYGVALVPEVEII